MGDLSDLIDLGDIGLDLSGAIGINLSDINIRVKELPKIEVGIDPVELSLRIKEIPSVRMTFPANFKMGFNLFGSEFFSINLCGQGQVITEPYVPNACECPNPLLPPSTKILHEEQYNEATAK